MVARKCGAAVVQTASTSRARGTRGGSRTGFSCAIVPRGRAPRRSRPRRGRCGGRCRARRPPWGGAGLVGLGRIFRTTDVSTWKKRGCREGGEASGGRRERARVPGRRHRGRGTGPAARAGRAATAPGGSSGEAAAPRARAPRDGSGDFARTFLLPLPEEAVTTRPRRGAARRAAAPRAAPGAARAFADRNVGLRVTAFMTRARGRYGRRARERDLVREWKKKTSETRRKSPGQFLGSKGNFYFRARPRGECGRIDRL